MCKNLIIKCLYILERYFLKGKDSTMIKKPHIIIVTQEFDPHTDLMMIELREKGYDPIRVHTEDFPLNGSISVRFGENVRTGILRTSKHILDANDIRSIWWRRPKPYNLPQDLSKDERIFVRNELEHTLYGMLYALDCYWMSFPPYIRIASYKPHQLSRAVELGFIVPKTLITMDPEEAHAFYEECDQNIVYKTLTQPQPIPDMPKAVYTTPIGSEQLEVLETVRVTPCQFQEYIPKRIELRVTVIGDDIFTAEIHSQAHERTSVDWRHYGEPTPIRQGHLPTEIAEQCYALTKSYGLNFGAIDMIVTPDGEYVFLEINPNGQWIWLQEYVPELKMKEAMISCLVRGNNSI